MGERAAEARAGAPRLVVVEGEAGIGKTALLQRFLSHLAGFTVLAASGDQTEGSLAYGVLTQLIAGTPTSVRGEFPLLPQVPSEHIAAFVVGAQFLALLGALQSSAPVAVVVEDLQWVDRASAEALTFTLRRLRNESVLVLATIREAPVQGERWDRLLREDRWITRLRLSGLETTEIVALAAKLGLPRLSRVCAQRLHEHTWGHPLHTQALMEELPPEALLHPGARLPAPQPLTSVVLSRLVGLPPASRDLLEALAVLGGRAPLGVAARLAGITAPSLALEQATGAGFLDRVPAGVSIPITFRHPLLRAVIYDDLSPTRRRSLHARAAELVGQREAWAHRVAAAEHTDPALAAELAAAAAAEGEQHTAAATYLLWASDLSATSDERDHRLLAAVARLLDYDPPWAAAMRPVVLACADSPLRSYVLGSLASLTGELTAAQQLLTAALHAGDRQVVAAAAVRLATQHTFLTHGEDAATAARIALAAQPADPWLIRQARMFLACGVALAEGVATGLAELADLPVAAAEVSVADAELLITRGVFHLHVGRFSAAAEDLVTGISRASDGARTVLLHSAHLHLAQAQYQLGAWDNAAINAERAITLALDEERLWVYPMVHAVAVLVPASRGDTATAAAHLDLARQCSQRLSSPASELLIALATAVLAQSRADHPGMLRVLEPLVSAPRVGLMTDAGAPWWPLSIEALIGTGQLRDAAMLLRDWTSRIEDCGPIHLRMILGWLHGWLCEQQGAPEQARECYERALAVTDSDAPPLPLARLRMRYGCLLQAAGDRRGAHAQLKEAYHRLAALGAAPYLRRVEAVLSAAGVRVHRPAKRDPLGLTGQQREVARLVARGMTNKEVAERLHISAKTVDYHLGQIYLKLGITSRRQLHRRLSPVDVAGTWQLED